MISLMLAYVYWFTLLLLRMIYQIKNRCTVIVDVEPIMRLSVNILQIYLVVLGSFQIIFVKQSRFLFINYQSYYALRISMEIGHRNLLAFWKIESVLHLHIILYRALVQNTALVERLSINIRNNHQRIDLLRQ